MIKSLRARRRVGPAEAVDIMPDHRRRTRAAPGPEDVAGVQYIRAPAKTPNRILVIGVLFMGRNFELKTDRSARTTP